MVRYFRPLMCQKESKRLFPMGLLRTPVLSVALVVALWAFKFPFQPLPPKIVGMLKFNSISSFVFKLKWFLLLQVKR